jgi:hypothetical protein
MRFSIIPSFLCIVFVFSFLPCVVFAADAKDPFFEVTSEHFRARHTIESEREMMQGVLRHAEEYYVRVAHDIGYSRYEDFWTWDRRVVIILYPDQYAFARFTGSPVWSKGYASRDARVFRERTIVSYGGQENFVDEVLPHEIAHLMLWDYLRTPRAVPVWFEEGVAQLQEAGKIDKVQEALRPVVVQGNYIPLSSLQLMTITGEKDNVKVSLFYAQSLSIVVFLIQKYGLDAFHCLCRELRDGMSFELALTHAYPSLVESLDMLEKRWVKYFSEQ